MVAHLYGEGVGLPQFGPLVALSHYSVEAVMGFFVLSGCVISLQDYATTGGYYRARLLRILPIYYAVFAISVVAMLACGVHFGLWQVIGNVFFLQSLDWEPLNPLRFFIPSWSLSFELYYYTGFVAIVLMPRLLLPLLATSIAVGFGLYLLSDLPEAALWLLRAFSFFAMWLGGVLITRLARSGHGVSLGTGAFMFAVGLCLARVPIGAAVKFDFARLFGVSVGFAFLVWALLSTTPLVADPARRRSMLDFNLPMRAVIAAATLVLLWGFSDSHRSTKVELSVLLLLFAVAPAFLADLAGRLLRPATPFMLYVAGLSYGLYLIHYPLLQTFNLWHPLPPLVDFAVVAVLSFLLAHALEYNFQPWIRAKLRPRRTAFAIPAAAAKPAHGD
jgi:peptidoglycan/LPS O-acetylase OafA/YrhL